MERLNIYDIVDKEFIESSDSESSKSDFDDLYYYYKPPLLEDYCNRNIVIVKPNQFTADKENVSINNYKIISKEDISDAADSSDFEFSPNKFTYATLNNIWSMGIMKYVQRKENKNARKSFSALFDITTPLQEKARKKSIKQKVYEAKKQQKKLLLECFILLIIIIICTYVYFVCIYA